MNIRLWAIGLLAISMLHLPASDSTDLNFVHEVPFIPLGTLQQIIGHNEGVWSWKWKKLDLSSYTPKIKQQVEADVKVTLSQPGEHAKWYQAPMKLDVIFKNPVRPFIYFVFVPGTEESGSIDQNLVYVYDLNRKSLIFKTYADPEMDYRNYK